MEIWDFIYVECVSLPEARRSFIIDFQYFTEI